MLALVCLACTRPAQGPLPGDSDNSYKPTERTPAAASPRAPWPDYAAARSWPAISGAPFVSRGHPPAGSVEVHVSPESQAAYVGLVPDTVFAEGALLTELSAHPGSGPSYAMRKMAGKWAFFELDSAGALVASGQLALCAGCHAEAPGDGVFGLPRDPPAPH